jgi:hypothetical protein
VVCDERKNLFVKMSVIYHFLSTQVGVTHQLLYFQPKSKGKFVFKNSEYHIRSTVTKHLLSDITAVEQEHLII